VESLDDCLELKRWLGERRPILGFDTETGGLEWWRQPLRLVQIGDAHRGFSIPFEWWGGLVREVFTKYEGEWVAHNAAFDCHFLERHGIPVPRERVHDTSVLAHIDKSYRLRALKKLAANLIDKSAELGQESLAEGMAKNGWTWGTVPVDFPPYWIYSALDPVLTARLWEKLHPSVSLNYGDVYDLEMATLFVCMDMESRGFRVDLDYTRDRMLELDDFTAQMYEWVGTEFGIKPGSNDAVANRLLRDGVRLVKLTDKGKWSVDDEVLTGLSGAHPLADAVRSYRQSRKFSKTYFAKILEMADGDVIHPGLNPLGARTARMSVSNPPLQQLPSDSPLVRDSFIAREGNTLVRIDFDQIEARLLAHFSNEPAMIEAITGGVDLHSFMAARMYGVETPTKLQRKLSKTGTFGKIYGIGAAKFAAQQGVTEAEARAFLAMFDNTFSAVPAFIRGVETVARQRLQTEREAYVTTPIGRRHYLPPRDDGFYKLVNYLIQGTAADVLKQKLVALDAAGLGSYLTLPVHDEVIFDVPKDDAEEVARVALQVMQDFDSFAVPLTAGAEFGPRWGDGYREAA
jgi:DNA polymerase-1